MIRLGILGAESSHAKAFAEYFLQKMPSGRPEGEEIRVSAVLDDGPQAAALARLASTLQPSKVSSVSGFRQERKPPSAPSGLASVNSWS